MENFYLFDSDFEDLHEIANISRNSSRVFRDRPNYLSQLSNWEFYHRFRMSKESFCILYDEIRTSLEPEHSRWTSLKGQEKLLMALRFYATGSFQITVGDFCGVHKSTVCRNLRAVSEEIASLRHRYIYMPRNQTECIQAARDFYNISKFPNVIGTIDGTHIRMQNPGGTSAEVFRNRKGFHSLNVQTVSGSDLQILDIVARYPGSTHDSFIFNNSYLKDRFESGEFQGFILLGDSGYPLKPYLMTPLRNPQTRAEKLFNESHIRTRNTVERQYGVLKRRFPCLSLGMRVKLRTQGAIIVACSVLHNFCIQQKDDLPNDLPNVELPEEIQPGNISFNNNYNDINERRLSQAKRNDFIAYFENLRAN